MHFLFFFSNSTAQNASSSADNSALRALQGMDITALLQKNQRMKTLRADILAGPSRSVNAGTQTCNHQISINSAIIFGK
jgi:hypothetical protein